MSSILPKRVLSALPIMFLVGAHCDAVDLEPMDNRQYARTLIEENCFKCYQASPSKYMEGVLELERANATLEIAGDLLMLARAYRALAIIQYREDAEKRDMYLKKERMAYDRFLELDPGNMQVYLEYVTTLDTEERIRILREILEQDPTNPTASSDLASILINTGNVDDGVKLLEHAYAHLTGHKKIAVGRQLMLTYRTLERNCDADLIKAEIAQEDRKH